MYVSCILPCTIVTGMFNMLFHRNTSTDANLPTSYLEVCVQHPRYSLLRQRRLLFQKKIPLNIQNKWKFWPSLKYIYAEPKQKLFRSMIFANSQLAYLHCRTRTRVPDPGTDIPLKMVP